MSHVVVVTGFNREAALVRRPGVTVIAGGGSSSGLEAMLASAAEGARGIASFGLTGALVDGLAIGDWVIGDRVDGAIGLACDARWRDALAAALPRARVGGFYADGRMIDSIAEKRALGLAHQALAVDMESHVAAREAARRDLPFAIVRCVSDGVDHLLPHAITVSMRPDGGVDAAAMARSMAARPSQLPNVARTIAGFARAFRELRRGSRATGERLACPY